MELEKKAHLASESSTVLLSFSLLSTDFMRNENGNGKLFCQQKKPHDFGDAAAKANEMSYKFN